MIDLQSKTFRVYLILPLVTWSYQRVTRAVLSCIWVCYSNCILWMIGRLNGLMDGHIWYRDVRASLKKNTIPFTIWARFDLMEKIKAGPPLWRQITATRDSWDSWCAFATAHANPKGAMIDWPTLEDKGHFSTLASHDAILILVQYAFGKAIYIGYLLDEKKIMD